MKTEYSGIYVRYIADPGKALFIIGDSRPHSVIEDYKDHPTIKFVEKDWKELIKGE